MNITKPRLLGLLVWALMLGFGTGLVADMYAAKWKPNIPDAKQIIAREAHNEEGKRSWQVEMRRGSEWPDLYVAAPGRLSKLCERFDK